jgi:hypothetical protein
MITFQNAEVQYYKFHSRANGLGYRWTKTPAENIEHLFRKTDILMKLCSSHLNPALIQMCTGNHNLCLHLLYHWIYAKMVHARRKGKVTMGPICLEQVLTYNKQKLYVLSLWCTPVFSVQHDVKRMIIVCIVLR